MFFNIILEIIEKVLVYFPPFWTASFFATFLLQGIKKECTTSLAEPEQINLSISYKIKASIHIYL